MKEKFIYPLLAILLAVISTNVSAEVTPPPQITQKLNVFTWRGDVPTINESFDWDFVDENGDQYTPATGILTPSFNDKKDMKLLGTPIQFFIAPKYYNTQPVQPAQPNIINEVMAKLDRAITPDGFKNNTLIKIATTNPPENNQVAIKVNNIQMTENFKDIYPKGSASPRRRVSIILEAQIAYTNYTPGANIGFQVPIIFSVGVIGETNPNL